MATRLLTCVLLVSIATLAHAQTDARARREFRAPSTGWLIISGPRGLAEFCDVTRAYNVVTGDAFVFDGCTERASAGKIPIQNVREALSALLLRRPASGATEGLRTTRSWRWMAGAGRHFMGDITWPGSANADEERAGSLLRTADVSLVEGCAPPLPPRSQALVAVLPTLVQMVSADTSQELTANLRRARDQWAKLAACPLAK